MSAGRAGRRRCEVAVVGSGPGGAITACLLAEAGRQVVLIEEGPSLDQSSCRPFSVEELLQKYRGGGVTAAMGLCKIPYVEGRVVGGGSEINSGLYHRAPGSALEDWRRSFGLQGASEMEMRAHFEACENDLSVGQAPGPLPPASAKLIAGARGCGLSSLEVPRMAAYGNEKDGRGAPRWTRQSMSRTYIRRALGAGGVLLADTRITSLRRSGRDGWLLRAEGSAAAEIEAERVFLACGAIQTPALLRRSGFTENIGNSLGLQPMLKVIAQFDGPVNAWDAGVAPHQVKCAATAMSLGCSIGSAPNLAMILAEHPDHAPGLSRNWREMLVFYTMIVGAGQGSVRPIPGFRDPLVRYRMAASDRKGLAEGLARLAEVLFEAGALHLYPAVSGLGRLSGRASLARLAQGPAPDAMRPVTVHVSSTCPMGENAAAAAVDSFGRVRGQKNLYVNDASMLCTPPGVNPQGTIMAFARRNALRFLGRL